MAEEVSIRFEVEGTDEASAEVERFNDGLGETGAQTRGATNSLSSFRGGLGAVTIGVGAATAALVGAYRAAKAFGDEMERQVGILNRTSGSIDAAARATGGLVNNIDLVTSRNRTMQAGMELTDQQFADLAEVAVDFAAATGGEAAPAIEQLSNALVNLSAEELRRYGIVVDTSKERTEQLASAMDQLRTRAAEMETGADSLGGAFARMSVEIDNTETELIQVADILAGDVEEGFQSLQIEMGGAEGESRSLTQALLQTVGQMTSLTDVLERAYNELNRVKDAASDLKREFELLNAQEIQIGPTTMGGAFDRASADVGITPAQRARARAIAANRREEEARRRNRSSGPSASDIDQENRQQSLQEDIAFARQRAQAQEAAEEQIRQARADTDEFLRNLDVEAEHFRDEQLKERVRKETEALDRLKQKRTEAAEQEKQEAQERNAQIAADAESILGPAISGITDALSAIIAGTKSADDAFQGLLSSFLSMIAEEAALSAAKEFAMAIASFATQDYGGGALHLAAGVAWSAVAVAAGAGAAATAPAEAAPVSPEQGSGGDGGGSGTTNIYQISGPVVTAGNRDLAGRDMGQIIANGERRYGRVA